VRGVWNQESARAALRLSAVFLSETRLFFLRVCRSLQGAFVTLGRSYKKSRVLHIVSLLATVPIAIFLFGIIYLNYNRADLPDLDAFIRFEPPTTGHIYDANGLVLIEFGRERREIIQYEEIPDVLRQAILSAEDENFFSHSGVD
jgi:penicillin-binding protein 1A